MLFVYAMDRIHLGTEGAHYFSTFDRECLGHGNNKWISFHRAHHGQRDARVSWSCFHNRLSWLRDINLGKSDPKDFFIKKIWLKPNLQGSLALGILNESKSETVLYRFHWVSRLHLFFSAFKYCLYKRNEQTFTNISTCFGAMRLMRIMGVRPIVCNMLSKMGIFDKMMKGESVA